MNHFFRLFFITSVLFVLLGLCRQNQDHSGSNTLAANATEQVSKHAGILTQHQEQPSPASLHLSFPLSGSLPNEPIRSREDRFTNLAKQELLLFELIFRDIKLDLMQRTGPFLYNSPRNEMRS